MCEFESVAAGVPAPVEAGASALAIVEPAVERAAPADRRVAPDLVLYTIQVPAPPAQVECPRCGLAFMAAGATGHADSEPICDLCLLKGCQPLGMVLALATVTRGFGVVDGASSAEYWDALGELGAFARIYERFAAQYGPARKFQLPDLGADG